MRVMYFKLPSNISTLQNIFLAIPHLYRVKENQEIPQQKYIFKKAKTS